MAAQNIYICYVIDPIFRNYIVKICVLETKANFSNFKI